MSKIYTITVSDEVEAALQKVAAKKMITTQKLIETQLAYYIGCNLYNEFPPSHPVSIPGLSIKERLEVNAEVALKGRDAGFTKADALIAARTSI